MHRLEAGRRSLRRGGHGDDGGRQEEQRVAEQSETEENVTVSSNRIVVRKIRGERD